VEGQKIERAEYRGQGGGEAEDGGGAEYRMAEERQSMAEEAEYGRGGRVWQRRQSMAEEAEDCREAEYRSGDGSEMEALD
jgi:hypothetical protein